MMQAENLNHARFVIILFAIFSVSKVSSEDLIQASQHGGDLGPVWVSKGESFNPKGAFDYFMAIAIDLKQRIKKSKEGLENVGRILFIMTYIGQF